MQWKSKSNKKEISFRWELHVGLCFNYVTRVNSLNCLQEHLREIVTVYIKITAECTHAHIVNYRVTCTKPIHPLTLKSFEPVSLTRFSPTSQKTDVLVTMIRYSSVIQGTCAHVQALGITLSTTIYQILVRTCP